MSKSMISTQVSFGQVVIGPPGSGKTTYCNGMQQFLTAMGRKCCVVNLDPANDDLAYDCGIDINDLISVDDVVKNKGLGPNGALVYCMEYLNINREWLLYQIKEQKDVNYFIFDCPGQVELYTHHKSLKNVIAWLASKEIDMRLTAVHLVDSNYCSDANNFISVLMTTLSTMMHMELPHINLLSKMDLAQKNGEFMFGLDYYTEVLDLSHILGSVKCDRFNERYHSLNKKICEVVEDYSLVKFIPLQVEDQEMMQSALGKIDIANGYSLGGKIEKRNMDSMLSVAVGAKFQFDITGTVQERYL